MVVNFSLNEIRGVARAVLDLVKGPVVFAFHGEMGAGKTTLIHAFCDELGVKDPVSSPTFSIINEYRSADGKPVYHLDLYRLKDEQEAIGAGVEDCLYAQAFCLVEWPEKAPALFPEHTVHCYIERNGNDTRNLRINL